MAIMDPVRHQPLTIDGERVADVVSLGLRVVVFTTDKRLAALDGKHYSCFESACTAVRQALADDKAAAEARFWSAARSPMPAKPRPAAMPLPSVVLPPLQPAALRRGNLSRHRH